MQGPPALSLSFKHGITRQNKKQLPNIPKLRINITNVPNRLSAFRHPSAAFLIVEDTIKDNLNGPREVKHRTDTRRIGPLRLSKLARLHPWCSHVSPQL